MERIQTGKIVNTHGIRGEVKVEPWSNDASDLLQIKTFYIDDNPYTVVTARCHKNSVLIRFAQVTDMTAAERLKNKILWADRDAFALDENEFFIEDLIGLSVLDADSGACYGKICDVLYTGANDVYDVLDTDGTHRLVPAIPDCVLHTDVQAGTMRIRPLKGLFER